MCHHSLGIWRKSKSVLVTLSHFKGTARYGVIVFWSGGKVQGLCRLMARAGFQQRMRTILVPSVLSSALVYPEWDVADLQWHLPLNWRMCVCRDIICHLKNGWCIFLFYSNVCFSWPSTVIEPKWHFETLVWDGWHYIKWKGKIRGREKSGLVKHQQKPLLSICTKPNHASSGIDQAEHCVRTLTHSTQKKNKHSMQMRTERHTDSHTDTNTHTHTHMWGHKKQIDIHAGTRHPNISSPQ